MIRANTTLVENYEYVSRHDEALEVTLPDFDAKWIQYMDGVGPAPIRPGAKPTVFTLRHLRTKERAELEKQMDLWKTGDKAEDRISLGAMISAFSMAVADVENFEDENGENASVSHEVQNGIRMLTENSIEMFPLEVIADVGARVLQRTYLSPK